MTASPSSTPLISVAGQVVNADTCQIVLVTTSSPLDCVIRVLHPTCCEDLDRDLLAVQCLTYGGLYPWFRSPGATARAIMNNP